MRISNQDHQRWGVRKLDFPAYSPWHGVMRLAAHGAARFQPTLWIQSSLPIIISPRRHPFFGGRRIPFTRWLHIGESNRSPSP